MHVWFNTMSKSQYFCFMYKISLESCDFVCLYTKWENYVYITWNLRYVNAPWTKYLGKTISYYILISISLPFFVHLTSIEHLYQFMKIPFYLSILLILYHRLLTSSSGWTQQKCLHLSLFWHSFMVESRPCLSSLSSQCSFTLSLHTLLVASLLQIPFILCNPLSVCHLQTFF